MNREINKSFTDEKGRKCLKKKTNSRLIMY